jgi:outer membrane immunogenic protein
MRKRFLTSAAVLAFSAGAAFASDLPTHKGPPPAPTPAPFSWTGFYIGGEAGFGWGEESDNFDSVTGFPLDHFGVSGPKGGVKAGYNQQFNNLVLGVEADIEASGIEGKKGTTTSISCEGTCVSTSSLSMRNTWQSSLRARAGLAFDRLLIYATGGLAIADDTEKYYVNDTAIPAIWAGSQTNTLYGWTIGAGAEYAIDSHWSASAELRYASFGHANYSIPASLSFSGTATSYSAGFNETLAQIGLSYHF